MPAKPSNGSARTSTVSRESNEKELLTGWDDNDEISEDQALVELIAGKLTREEAVRAVQQAHRNYAKRQITWFRREPDVKWILGFGDERSVIEQSISFIRETR